MSITVNSQFQMVDERGWRRGYGNLLKGELSSWFRSIRWLKHLLLWVLAIDGLMAIMAFAISESAPGKGPPFFLMYGIFGGMTVAIGVMIIMQGAIVGEKRSGTAAWVLSKPVTRTAFVVSRLVGNTLGVLLTSVLVPGVVVYLIIGELTPYGWLPPLDFLAGVAVLALATFFWLTLTLMAGTFVESAGGVIAIPMVVFFAMWFIPGVLPFLAYISPVALFIEGETSAVAVSLINGQAPFSWMPVISAAIFSVVFIAVAIWRFNRQEF